MCSSPTRLQHCRTTYQTTFSEIPEPQTLPLLATARNIFPFVTPAAEIHSSSACLAHLRNGNGANVSTLTDQIDYGPVPLAGLNVISLRSGQFRSSQTTAKKDRQHCTVSFGSNALA